MYNRAVIAYASRIVHASTARAGDLQLTRAIAAYHSYEPCGTKQLTCFGTQISLPTLWILVYSTPWKMLCACWLPSGSQHFKNASATTLCVFISLTMHQLPKLPVHLLVTFQFMPEYGTLALLHPNYL